MKKNLISILSLILALAALGTALFSIGGLKKTQAALESRIAALEAQQPAAVPEETAPQAPSADESTDAYCNLVVGDWFVEDGSITMDVFAEAMLPEDAAVSEAVLLLIQGETMQSQTISMSPGEAAGSFVADLTGIVFSLPELDPGAEVELQLQVTFNGGLTISAGGISWYESEGQLHLVSG